MKKLFIVGIIGILFCSCKKDPGEVHEPAGDVSSSTGQGGAGGELAVTSVSVTSTAAGTGGYGGTLDAGVPDSSIDSNVCRSECPIQIPEVGSFCDVVLDQYCEYGSPTCKIASCNGAVGEWEVADLNPCICF